MTKDRERIYGGKFYISFVFPVSGETDSVNCWMYIQARI